MQANMGALVSTIMLTALFAMPTSIGKEEWTQFFGQCRAPTCDQLNTWGLDNATSGVKIGICASTHTRCFGRTPGTTCFCVVTSQIAHSRAKLVR